jgi:hypothetical protein
MNQRSRRRAHLVRMAQLPGQPLGHPPRNFSGPEHECWQLVERAAPNGVLQATDAPYVAVVARTLALWRAGHGDRTTLRLLARMLSELLIDAPERRWLLVPHRPSRGARQ